MATGDRRAWRNSSPGGARALGFVDMGHNFGADRRPPANYAATLREAVLATRETRRQGPHWRAT